jgi:hypothetical protein
MNPIKPHILDTSKQVIDFLESISIFIEHVHITEVHSGGFSFCVKVPIWYKYLFGWWLRMKVKKEFPSRLPIGITFDFKLHT